MGNIKSFILSSLREIDSWVSDRVGPVRVVFVVRNEIGFSTQAPVLCEMAKFPEFLIHTTSDGDEDKFNFKDKDLQELYDQYEIPADRAVFMKWHYMIASDVLNLYFRRDCLHVETAHGSAFGNLYRKTDWMTTQILQPCTNLIFASSQSLRHYVEATHPQVFDPSHRLFFPVGYPKLDKLVNGAFSREKTLQELGLPLDKKTILISSHWNEYSKLRKWGAAFLEALLPLTEQCNIIVTAHPKLWELPETANYSPSGLWNDLKAIEARNKGIRIIKSGNAINLLNAADLLISGNSSIRVEYSVLDRPALFHEPLGKRFSSPVVQQLYEKSAFCFSELEALPDLALKALQQPDALREGQQALKDYFLSNPGKSTEIMVKVIRKIGRASSPRSKAWKIAQELSRQCQAGQYPE